jgi:6-phosphogluconolactonase
MKPLIHIFKTQEDLANSFAVQLISWIDETAGDTFNLALSGGKTPSLLFSILAEKYSLAVPWHKIHFWWGDERMVSPEDQESNYGVVHNLLFSKIKLSANQIHRIRGESNPDEERERYGLEIKRLIQMSNNWPVFDLIMLGLGDDGHTASIFPDQMHLMNSDEVTEIAFHPATGQQRITLTGKVFNNAKRVAFQISGSSKAKVFNEIISNSEKSSVYPASYINPQGELHWFLDDGHLSENPNKI